MDILKEEMIQLHIDTFGYHPFDDEPLIITCFDDIIDNENN